MGSLKKAEYEAKRQRIVEMLESGATLKEIKTTLGYKSYCQIYKVRDELNGKRDRALWVRKNYKYEKHDDEVVKMREEGATYKEIASFFGYKSVSSVEQILRKHNAVDSISEKEARNKSIIEARKHGVSMSALADQFGVTHSCVSSVCRANGVGGKLARNESIDYGYGECALCGARFKKKAENQKFCTSACRKRASWRKHDPLRDKRFKGAIIDNDITLHKLFRMSGGVCYLCGGACDWNAKIIINGRPYAKAKYPSIDHVIPLSKGGEHSWNNVRLAHLGCNSSKGAKM